MIMVFPSFLPLPSPQIRTLACALTRRDPHGLIPSMNTLFAVLLVAAFAFGGACPDLGALRTPHVRQDLAPERLEGLWYEQAYIDFAQVGASCQTMNASYAPESGDLSVDFRVLYAGVPFTLPLLYKPVDGTDSKGIRRRPALTGCTARSLWGIELSLAGPCSCICCDCPLGSLQPHFSKCAAPRRLTGAHTPCSVVA